MATHLLGIGTSVPRYQVDCQESAEFAERTTGLAPQRARKVVALYRRTGIRTRGSVLLDVDADQNLVSPFYPPATDPSDAGPTTAQRSDRYAAEAPELAEKAARQALRDAGVQAGSVTHLVTVSCTGFSAPGIDIALIDRLGLPAGTQRVQIGFMGCHGAINGLRAANGLIAADPDAIVLMCCVELCSLHYQYGQETDQVLSGALFADGAAAVVLGRASDRQRSRGSVLDTGSYLIPASRDAMSWKIGNHGYVMTLSAQVPGYIESCLPGVLCNWLSRVGESVASIGGWAVHPGGTRILSAVETALDLESHALQTSRDVLAAHGNMSSATMVFILARFAQENLPKPWLMLGFGPGLEVELALIR